MKSKRFAWMLLAHLQQISPVYAKLIDFSQTIFCASVKKCQKALKKKVVLSLVFQQDYSKLLLQIKKQSTSLLLSLPQVSHAVYRSYANAN